MIEKRFTYDSKTVSILKDGEFWLDGTIDTACNHSEICDLLNEQHEEKETYKRLFNEMAYYFRDNIKSLNDLDHKDFESLQLLTQGEYFDEELLCWCKVKLEDLE